jgi:hypothetical protein
METQTVEFRSPPSQTITAKLFTVGSDTEQAAVSATEATNRKGTYSAAFTDEAAGEYELIAFVGAVPVARWFVTLTLTTATFQTYDKARAELDSAVETKITNIENASGYMLAVLAGACADPQTASETYSITVFGSTFTVDMAGQTSTGTRTAPTLTKS